MNVTTICQNCGKGMQFANLVSHAKNRTHMIRRPNLHWAKVVLADGGIERQRLCTKCLRMAVRPHRIENEKSSVIAA